MGRVTIKDFPDAPAGSYVSEEGWLICANEAWTVTEWADRTPRLGGLYATGGRPVRYDDEAHRKAREKKRQQREKAA